MFDFATASQAVGLMGLYALVALAFGAVVHVAGKAT
jgi:hypothetical protein